MATIMISSSMLNARAQELDDLNNQFKTQVSALEEKEQALKAMYEGDAATAFHNAFARDKVQMDNFFNCITRYAQVMREIAAKMAQTESENQNIATTRSY